MKFNFLISGLLAGMIVSSCTTNHEEHILDEAQTAKFNVSLTSSNESLKTRTGTEVGTDQENALSHVAFYVFKETGSLEKSVAATAEELASGAYSINCTTGKKYVYAITNDEALFKKVAKGVQKSDFELLVTEAFATAPASPFTMVGKHAELLSLSPSTDGTTPSANVTIDVTRLAGKVTVALSDSAKTKFTVTGFKIVNANPYSNYFLQATSSKEGANATQIDPNNEAEFDAWTDAYYKDNYAYVGAAEAAYALENWNTDPRRGNTTCIIIEGKYTGEGASGANTFYRVNLGGKEAKWAFNRNTHYKVTISDVYEDGYETEDKAEQPEGTKPTDPLVQDVKLSASLQITPWTVVVQNDEIGKE
ncbi:MAG: fimbrial protein [Tannerellaceae bacterium]